jgi:hypothetical protein
MQALSQYMLASYQERMARRIAADFPVEFEKLGDKVGDFIRQGIEKAGSYGIEAESDVSRYIDLTLRFGAGFESLDKMKWAAVILEDESISGRAKMDFIYSQLPLHTAESE